MVTLIIAAAVALLVGFGAGYYLRMVLLQAKRGSVEIEIKQKLIAAKEEAQRILDEAKKKAEDKEGEIREEEKKRAEDYKKTEERFIKKRSF